MKIAWPAAIAMSITTAAADDAIPTSATLGWPAGTVTLAVTITTHVRASASSRAAAIGKIVAGTRVAWTTIAAGDHDCPGFVAIAPQGWLCVTAVTPTALSVGGVVQPMVAPRAILPGEYFDVSFDDTPAYATTGAARAGEPTELLSTHVMVRSRGEVEIDGMDYQQTNKGLVPSSEVQPLSPSTFVGIDLRTTPAPWPMAFVAPAHPAVVRATPDAAATVVAHESPRAVVWVKSERDAWVEIGADAWVRARDVRMVRPSPAPLGVGAEQPWIDIDLDQQTLVAYQGPTPVYVTLVSSGRRAGTTPVGIYRIRAKAATTGMASEANERAQYDVGAVPWALRWRSGLFIHAAYWHDEFGDRRSHGCVNVAPRDARALYEWVTPIVPVGWSELEIAIADGVVVRVRDDAHPDPAWFDYATDGEPAHHHRRRSRR